ncbi:hypothetical protein A11A3_05676 [Alcanivorax hongdengensis A-11-3]|uniref:MAPEG family protein n=1 Tax=Alcanivorax hongdengensis A-11-3 TaxID=1177179 RepID=L0WDP1_9GAMM|nr:MAPEG family protein [Alcanivorax hongdengensis]EKF74918.1 hypothetical protein A11A3_05676 [Alcanivorax hongdengensis A-11-3]
MTHEHLAALSLLAYAGWGLALLLLLLTARGLMVLSGKAKADAFPPYHYNPACPLNRLSRAYMNTLELLGILIVVVGVSLYLGYADLAAELMPWLVAARVAQSLVHLMGVNHWLVLVRFSFFFVQVALVVCLVAHILVQVL